jgi:DNA-directed RNA polymerase specialized sigma24 family protein/CheY-like chemotaxis protein
VAVASEQVLPHIPYLRRHARLLTGSKDVGDEYVRICLELIVAEPERLEAHDVLRVALFRAFYAAWSAFNKVERDSVDDPISLEERLEQGLAALPPIERRVLLLVVVEDLALDDVAWILELTPDAARAYLASARMSLKQEVELPVLIIEDEPMIAMELSQIVREMGFSVAATAARQEDAVVAAGTGETTDLGLVLADIELQDRGSGIVAAQAILERYDVPIVFVTGFPERLLTGDGLEPTFVVAKPFEAESLKVTIAHAVATYAKAREAVEHRARVLAKLRQITARRGIDSATPPA